MRILDNCKVNDVLAITYGDTPTERVVRVIKIRDLEIHPLSAKTLQRRPTVERGTRLVTCQDTKGQIRAFYAGVEQSARKVPLLRAAFLCLKGKLPRRCYAGTPKLRVHKSGDF